MQNQTPGTIGMGSSEEVILNFQTTSALMVRQFIQANQSVMMLYLQCNSRPVAAPNRYQTPFVLAPGPMAAAPYIQRQQSAEKVMPLPTVPVPVPVPQSDVIVINHSPTGSDEQDSPIPEQLIDSAEQQPTAEELIENFVKLVSERTGYPIDMLDPGLDLESDLGIDSIKRVEIISKFRTTLSPAAQEKLESNIEQVAGVRTIQEISEWIRNTSGV